MKKIRVVELFAGVGGFRIGFEKANEHIFNLAFETVWANQWEPSSVKQHAAEIYISQFSSKNFSNQDIEKVIETNFESIPDHDLLVGGFPCQDYSVARTLSKAKGLIGKKGVLFWSIYSILKRKAEKAPDYIFLENVDRLLKSPATQRGKDFAVMLTALSGLDYAIEWRVVNPADYGMPQRRRRIFILGYKKGTKLYKQIESIKHKSQWLVKDGVLASAFPAEEYELNLHEFAITGSPKHVTDTFSADSPQKSPFENAGLMINKLVTTAQLFSLYDGPRVLLGDIIEKNEKKIPAEFYIDEKKLPEWIKQKGAKNEERTTKSGHVYHYSEGAMAFPDSLDKPSRTIVTGEGGSGASRFKHVVKTKSGRYRRLMPIELEKLNMFPPDHTKLEGVSDTKRAFIMGNALVVGAIQRVGESLAYKK